jgi:hypothetical protein
MSGVRFPVAAPFMPEFAGMAISDSCLHRQSGHHPRLAQQLEPLFYTQKVAGAIPAPRTIFIGK